MVRLNSEKMCMSRNSNDIFFESWKLHFVGIFHGGFQFLIHLEAGEDALTLAPAISWSCQGLLQLFDCCQLQLRGNGVTCVWLFSFPALQFNAANALY